MITRIFLAVAFVTLAFVGSIFLFSPRPAEAENIPPLEVIFEGTVYDGSSPVPAGITVKCHQGTMLKASGTTFDDGFYEIRGSHSQFPSNAYRLVAKEGQSDEGSYSKYHQQGTVTTVNILLGQHIAE